MPPTGQIAVIGAGSWGTALAKLLADDGKDVIMWGHRAEHIADIDRDRENKTYLPGFSLPPNLKMTHDLKEAVSNKKNVVMVVPTHVYREVFQNVVPFLVDDTYVISASKGIENRTLLTMTRIMADVLRGSGKNIHLGVLSGPSFAREVAQRVPTAVTVAAHHRQESLYFQELFFTERFRVYASNDVIGLELGGALKNIVAIATGISDGLGYGTNTRAALITRGLAEISKLGIKMGANPLTLSGLGGMGDLVLTCTGDLSRNRYVGLQLGRGKKIQEIIDEMNMVAEGVKTTRSAFNLAVREGVEMPILEQVYRILYEDKPCNDAVLSLLTRSQKEEMHHLDDT